MRIGGELSINEAGCNSAALMPLPGERPTRGSDSRLCLNVSELYGFFPTLKERKITRVSSGEKRICLCPTTFDKSFL